MKDKINSASITHAPHLPLTYAVTERRCIQGGLTPAYSDYRGRMIRSGVTNGCAG
jgi:hypothetical protein